MIAHLGVARSSWGRTVPTAADPTPAPAYASCGPVAAPPGAVRCVWRHRVAPQPTDPPLVVPDACMDMIWDGRDLWVADPDTGPMHERLRPGSLLVGLRFQPGVGPAVLGVPGSELRDRRVPLVDLWGPTARDLAEHLAAGAGVGQLTGILENAVRSRLLNGAVPDPEVSGLVRRLADEAGHGPVSDLADDLGLSERQLLRRSQAALGYGPATFVRILRFQRLMVIGRHRSTWSLGRLALAVGYADQAHMGREVRRLSGLTPRNLRAGWMSDPYKTQGESTGMMAS